MALGATPLATPLAITHVGACTALGLTALQTGFVYRTGSAGMRESAVLDAEGTPATVCSVPTLEPELVGPARLYQLLDYALVDLASQLQAGLDAFRMKLLVLLDAAFAQRLPNGGVRADLVAADIRDRVAGRLGARMACETLAGDAAGFASVLPKLAAELTQGAYDACLVVAPHSDYEPERIVELSSRGRLFTSDNLDALIPGEGAAALIVTAPALARRLNWPVRAQVHSVASTFEKAMPDNDESAFEAAGMTVAVRRACEAAPLRGERVGWLMSDINLEAFRVHEFQAVMARAQRLFGPPQVCDTPAHRFGYLGAAVMPMHLVLACHAWRHCHAPHAWMMSMAGNDAGERACLLASG